MNQTRTFLSNLKGCWKLAGDQAEGRRPRSALHLAAALKGRGNGFIGFSGALSGRDDSLLTFLGCRCAQPQANFRQPFRLRSMALARI